MATTAAPHGAVAVNRLGGYEGGSFRQLKVTNSYGTSLFFGDWVQMANTGTIEHSQAATTARPIGAFHGCTYTDPTLNYKLHSQMWTASTTATDILAYVSDDPHQVWQMQADESLAQTALGLNIQMITYAAGNTNIGRSIIALDGSTEASTTTFPFRLTDFVRGPFSEPGDTYTDMLITCSAQLHHYGLKAGI